MAENTFLIKYKSGKTLTDTVDAENFPDVETYCQKRYGLSAEDAAEHGNVVTKVDQEKPAEKTAETPAPETPAPETPAPEAKAKK